jgi:hypothetical protein
MKFLARAVAALVVLAYMGMTTVFFFDWERLSQSMQLSGPVLLLYCLLSGGAVSAVSAAFSLKSGIAASAAFSAALFPIEVVLGYVLISAGLGYWLSVKVVLACISALLVWRFQRASPTEGSSHSKQA